MKPDKQHYNPEIFNRLNAKQIVEMKLPVKGQEANPAELFQATIQDKVARWRRRGRGNKYVGVQDFKDIQTAVSDALEELKYRPDTFLGYYQARATGKHMRDRWSKERQATDVARHRQQDGAPPFQWPPKL